MVKAGSKSHNSDIKTLLLRLTISTKTFTVELSQNELESLLSTLRQIFTKATEFI